MKSLLESTIAGCICIMLIMGLSPIASAGSFDLIPQGTWVYGDLTLLADSKLLAEYADAQELVDVFPLARYEVAILIGDLLVQAEQGLDTALDFSIPSADLLMLRILKGRATGEAVRLSSGTVAEARVNSETALKALRRLVVEFAKELEGLGIDHDAWLMGFGKGNKNSLSLRGDPDLRIAPPGPTIWRTYGILGTPIAPQIGDDDVMPTEPVGDTPSVALGESVLDAYDNRPVELSALLGQFDVYDEPTADIYQVSDDLEGMEVADGSLKLQPSMAERRPVGLLSSYFADLDVR